jgi:hypothetical protein
VDPKASGWKDRVHHAYDLEAHEVDALHLLVAQAASEHEFVQVVLQTHLREFTLARMPCRRGHVRRTVHNGHVVDYVACASFRVLCDLPFSVLLRPASLTHFSPALPNLSSMNTGGAGNSAGCEMFEYPRLGCL